MLASHQKPEMKSGIVQHYRYSLVMQTETMILELEKTYGILDFQCYFSRDSCLKDQ